MTSKISLVKKHPVFSFFKFTLKKQTPLTLLVTAFTLLICPGMILRDANDDLMREYSLGYWEFATFSFIILGAAVALVCMLLLLNFNFLFNKKAGDMYNALPLTRNQLLLSRSISAFIGGFFLMTLAYAGLVLVNFLPTVEGVGAVTAINTYLFMLLSLMVLTAFCLLIGVCCGGYFDTVIAFAAINIAPVIIVAFIFGFVEESVTGLVFDYMSLVYLTPVALIFYKIMNLPTCIERPEIVSAMNKTTALTVIGLAVFGAFCLFTSIKLFGKRKSETAGEAYSFKFMPIIISLLVSMVGGFVIAVLLTGDYSVSGGFWFFFVICAILCSIAIGAITNRGFKKVKGSIISGAFAAALMAALIISGLFIGDYAEKKIPTASSVKQVYVGEIDFTEHKDLVVNFHKGIIECINEADYNAEYGEFPEVLNNFCDFHFEYTLKNGSIMKRSYWYRYPDMSRLHSEILAFMQTDSFFKKYEKCIVAEPNYSMINVHSHSTKFGTMEEGEEPQNAILTEKEAAQLISLFKKEMQAADISVFKEDTYGISISGNEWCELYIPRSFTETINFLEAKFAEYEAQND